MSDDHDGTRTRERAILDLQDASLVHHKRLDEHGERITELEKIERKLNLPVIGLLAAILLTLVYIAWVLHAIAQRDVGAARAVLAQLLT